MTKNLKFLKIITHYGKIPWNQFVYLELNYTMKCFHEIFYEWVKKVSFFHSVKEIDSNLIINKQKSYQIYIFTFCTFGTWLIYFSKSIVFGKVMSLMFSWIDISLVQFWGSHVVSTDFAVNDSKNYPWVLSNGTLTNRFLLLKNWNGKCTIS